MQVQAEKNHLPVGSDRTNKFTTPPGDISGTVTDVRNVPLAGATVTIKGTRTSTVTDQNGKFTLKNVADNAVLQVSFSGYLTEEVAAKAGAKVTMREQVNQLTDVVVIGYGTAKKKILPVPSHRLRLHSWKMRIHVPFRICFVVMLPVLM